MLKGINIKHIRNLRIISYVYLLLLSFDDNPSAIYFAIPWIFYLLYDSYRIGVSTKKALFHFGIILFFLLSLLYNKSESNLYHPMIGDEIVLPNDVYISKGYIAGKFNVSDSNFSLRNEKMLLLPKGETIRIVSFIRGDILNFNPYYDLEIDTALNQQILDQFDPNGSTKGPTESRLYVWSNNFFDALGILSNEKVDKYSRTTNGLFTILYMLYPFALLYLLLQILKNRMKTIQTNYNFHPLSLVLYTVAFYYILLASINDGFSGFLLGTPYTLFLLWEIWYLKRKSKIKYLHICILLLAVFLLFSDRSRSQFFYPMVGKTYTIVNDVNYSYDSFYINELEIYDRLYNSHLGETKPKFQLESGDRLYIERQIVTGHADMGITYTYEIKSENFAELRDYISNNLTKIKSELHKDYAQNLNSNKTEFYFDDEKKFYIGDHELRTLLKTQSLPYNEQRVETRLTYLSFFLLVYPVILALFFLILTFRNKEIFYGKHNKSEEPIKNSQADF